MTSESSTLSPSLSLSISHCRSLYEVHDMQSMEHFQLDKKKRFFQLFLFSFSTLTRGGKQKETHTTRRNDGVRFGAETKAPCFNRILKRKLHDTCKQQITKSHLIFSRTPFAKNHGCSIHTNKQR